MPSEATLEIRPALGGRFLELSYRAGGFEGRAFYRPAGDGRWRATWFDNRGITFPIEAVAGGPALTADWGSAETERGRTVYRLAEDGRLDVTDSCRRRGRRQRDIRRATSPRPAAESEPPNIPLRTRLPARARRG